LFGHQPAIDLVINTVVDCCNYLLEQWSFYQPQSINVLRPVSNYTVWCQTHVMMRVNNLPNK